MYFVLPVFAFSPLLSFFLENAPNTTYTDGLEVGPKTPFLLNIEGICVLLFKKKSKHHFALNSQSFNLIAPNRRNFVFANFQTLIYHTLLANSKLQLTVTIPTIKDWAGKIQLPGAKPSVKHQGSWSIQTSESATVQAFKIPGFYLVSLLQIRGSLPSSSSSEKA